nr:eukaryotic translation initiation factor 4E-binding protein 1 [Dromaius novaehollandiae]
MQFVDKRDPLEGSEGEYAVMLYKASAVTSQQQESGEARCGFDAMSYLLSVGTRIIYDRKFLMECRNSPVAKTPPSDLPDIPGVTSPNVEESKTENNHVQNYDEKVSVGEEEQFDMDI